MVAGVGLVCTPMVLALLLLLAVQWPKMDGATRRMPEATRSLVVDGILATSRSNDGAFEQQRAERLDAAAAKEYRLQVRKVAIASNPPEMQEMYNQQVESKKTARALCKRPTLSQKPVRDAPRRISTRRQRLSIRVTKSTNTWKEWGVPDWNVAT
jgi:hypothetical protein